MDQGGRAGWPRPASRDDARFPSPILALAPLRREAEQQGSREFSTHWAGQAAPLGREMPAEVLTRALAEAALKRFRELAGQR